MKIGATCILEIPFRDILCNRYWGFNQKRLSPPLSFHQFCIYSQSHHTMTDQDEEFGAEY